MGEATTSREANSGSSVLLCPVLKSHKGVTHVQPLDRPRQLSRAIHPDVMATFDAQIRMMFGQRNTDEQGRAVRQYIKLRRDGSDTVADVKSKIAVFLRQILQASCLNVH